MFIEVLHTTHVHLEVVTEFPHIPICIDSCFCNPLHRKLMCHTATRVSCRYIVTCTTTFLLFFVYARCQILSAVHAIFLDCFMSRLPWDCKSLWKHYCDMLMFDGYQRTNKTLRLTHLTWPLRNYTRTTKRSHAPWCCKVARSHLSIISLWCLPDWLLAASWTDVSNEYLPLYGIKQPLCLFVGTIMLWTIAHLILQILPQTWRNTRVLYMK